MSEPTPKNNQNTQQAEQTAETTIPLLPIPADRALTEDDLPTEAQIKQLFEHAGRRAVVAYAYRNAVRVLPFITMSSFTRNWGRDIDRVKHSFAIIRALALLNAFLRGNRAKVDFRAAAAYAALYGVAAADAAAAAAAAA